MSVIPLRGPTTAGVIAQIMLIAAASRPDPLNAQPLPPVVMDDVVITATGSPQRIESTLTEVTVIDRTQIEAATGRTLVELLSQQPGIQSANNGGLGKASSLFIRGMESRHTLLLIDGVRYASATLGTPVWENLPLDAIERIEIVRGPLSSLYGSDAVAGVVQIFTRPGTPGLAGRAAGTVGSNKYGELGAGLRFGQGAFDGAVSAGYVRTDGFSATNQRVPFGNFNPDDDGFEQTYGSARLGLKLGEQWRLDATALLSKGETQYDDGPGADAHADLRTEVLGLQASGRVLPAWQTTFRIGRSVDGYDTLASASPFASLGLIETTQQQYTWENNVTTPIGTLLVLADRVEQKVRRPGEPFTVSSRDIDGIALGLSGRAGPHGWQASARHDSNSQFGDQNTWALAYGYDLTPSWRLSGSYGTSFVAPSFNQLYFPGFGNPNLLPEEGEHTEVALRWVGAGQQLRLTWFNNDIDGYISSGSQPVNIPRTRIDGWTLSWEGGFAGWMVAASADYIDPRNTTAGSPNEDKLLPRRSRKAARLSVDTPRWSGWQGGATFVAFDERYDNAANTLRVPGYGVLDLRLDWQFAPAWNAALKLNNVFDKEYETIYGYNQAGREVYLTLRYAMR